MAKDRQLSLTHTAFGNVRVIQRNGNEFWFVAKDVCDILELGNTTEALRGLDDDEVATSENLKLRTDGGRDFKIISESGLYTLLIRSNKPQARPFRRWVTKEVLPNIRKYGSYSTDPAKMGRIVKEANRKASGLFLQKLDESTSDTDKARVRKLAGIDSWHMSDVLGNRKEDPALVAMLMGRAIGSKQMHGMFYEIDGLKEMNEVLDNYHRVMGRRRGY